MYVAIRKTPKRFTNQRHTNFVDRSLGSRKYFGQPSSEAKCFSSLQSPSSDRFDSSNESKKSHPSNQTNFHTSTLPRKTYEIGSRRRDLLSSRYHNSSPYWSNLNSTHSSQDAAFNLLRTTLGSQTAYKNLIFDPLNSCFGLPSRKTYQLDSRVLFSSGAGGRSGTDAKIPTPKSPESSGLSLSNFDATKILNRGLELTWSMTKMVLMFLIRLPGNTLYYLINPQKRRDKIAEIRDIAKKEFDHYWTGSKLLMADVRTARSLLARTLQGSTLSRRERKQLLRTVTDLFRLVPFSMFILIPFMEAALPFAIRLFPNMLPSTFQDSLKSEENMKRELKSRIAMAQFFQETLEDLAKEQKRIAGNRNTETPDDKISSKQIESAASLLEFLDRARNGEMMPPEVIVQYANYFQDDLTLDNMPRMQLINMCKYMSIPPYGYDNFLRFQLRHRIKSLKEDDQRILWEGINSLTKMELREACQERGMRSTGLSKQAYKQSLQQWLDLSVNKNVPISLLVMSRTFFLQKETIQPAAGDEAASVAGLADAISGLDKEVLNEVILEVATSEEKKSNPDVRKIKLEVLSHQNEKIREEQAERESAAKKKESAEKAEEAEAEPQEATLEPPEEQDASLGKKKAEEAQEDSADTVTEKFFDDTSVKMEEKPGEKELRIEVPESLVEEEKAEEKGEEKRDLSADEIEALEGWVSADPVKKEKEDLERLKSAMKESSEMEQSEEDAEQEKSETDDLAGALASKSEDVFESAEKYAASVVEEAEKKAIEEAEKSTSISADSTVPERASPDQEPSAEQEAVASEPEEEEEEDMVVAKLKKRLESMVDKIEIQLSDAQVKIGDKLHFLDKDMDGILSREEIVESLQQVLRREITSEEAVEIVSEMDEDGDGVLTVQELIKWIDTNKLVKLESEGRDADMDRIMDKQRAGHRDEEQSPDDARQEPESGKTTEQSS